MVNQNLPAPAPAPPGPSTSASRSPAPAPPPKVITVSQYFYDCWTQAAPWTSLYDLQIQDNGGRTADVHLFCADGCVPVHTALLAHFSPMMASLLESQGSNWMGIRTVNLAEAKVEYVKSAINLLYNGSTALGSAADKDKVLDMLKLLGIQIDGLGLGLVNQDDESPGAGPDVRYYIFKNDEDPPVIDDWNENTGSEDLLNLINRRGEMDLGGDDTSEAPEPSEGEEHMDVDGLDENDEDDGANHRDNQQETSSPSIGQNGDEESGDEAGAPIDESQNEDTAGTQSQSGAENDTTATGASEINELGNLGLEEIVVPHTVPETEVENPGDDDDDVDYADVEVNSKNCKKNHRRVNVLDSEDEESTPAPAPVTGKSITWRTPARHIDTESDEFVDGTSSSSATSIPSSSSSGIEFLGIVSKPNSTKSNAPSVDLDKNEPSSPNPSSNSEPKRRKFLRRMVKNEPVRIPEVSLSDDDGNHDVNVASTPAPDERELRRLARNSGSGGTSGEGASLGSNSTFDGRRSLRAHRKVNYREMKKRDLMEKDPDDSESDWSVGTGASSSKDPTDSSPASSPTKVLVPPKPQVARRTLGKPQKRSPSGLNPPKMTPGTKDKDLLNTSGSSVASSASTSAFPAPDSSSSEESSASKTRRIWSDSVENIERTLKTCQICNKLFKQAGDAAACITRTHGRIRCYYCFGTCKNQTELYDHYGSEHSTGRQGPGQSKPNSMSCILCNEQVSFYSVSSHLITRHMTGSRQKVAVPIPAHSPKKAKILDLDS